MNPTARRRAHDARLMVYVTLGVLAGATYVVFDVLSEAKIQSGTLTGAFADAHAVVDHGFPILVGALLGVCVHYARLRAKLVAAEEEASRAEALRERLQKVERDQAVWVVAAAILHELNNPLHALYLLLDELDAAAEADERTDLIARARGQAERAISRLKALRSMPRSGEPELQRVALGPIVDRVAADLGRLLVEDGLVVRTECARPVYASADPAYVRTILENLLDNSFHSLRSQGGGSVTVELASESGRAIVRVRDDGPAMQEGVRAALFEPLRTTKSNGLGLGLPIARALARAMRGDLRFDDGTAPGFVLDLPLRGES